MEQTREALPQFAFSRRNPGPILALADKRRRQAGGVRLLALGGQPRDRIYCAQLLADAAGQAFLHVDLNVRQATVADDKAALERMLAFGRATPTTLCIDGSETLYELKQTAPGKRAEVLGGYLQRSLGAFDGTVVFGFPEQVEADYARLPPLDMQVTFRAPSGNVIAGNPVLLPSHLIEEELLPGHNFQVEIDGVEAGMCAVSAPQLLAGPYTQFEFSPPQGIQSFLDLPHAARADWPVLTLRRGVTQSKLFFDWKHSQYGGKPLVRDVQVRQLDWKGRRVVNTWIVRGCWAKSWTGPDFDAVQGSVAQEQLALYYQEVIWR